MIDDDTERSTVYRRVDGDADPMLMMATTSGMEWMNNKNVTSSTWTY